MIHSLADLSVAILVADGFELPELAELKRTLEDSGARTSLVSLERGSVKGWAYDHFGASYAVDIAARSARAEDFDALLVTSAVLNPDALRHSTDAVNFVRGFFRDGKPVAAIYHGLQGMLDADVVRDRTVTSFPSVRTELINAGAKWVDAAVVVDHGLVTSRSPADLEDFKARMVEEFAAHGHSGTHPSSGG
jgi:protease I